MKKIITLSCFLVVCSLAFSQTSDSTQSSVVSCYQEYAKVFQVRGAYNVPDGTYDHVIYTFRRAGSCECYMGKATVIDGHIDLTKMYLKFVDGSYKHIVKKMKYNSPIDIVNGMSNTMVTVNDELINVLFVKKIKPKPKALQQAPMPDFNL